MKKRLQYIISFAVAILLLTSVSVISASALNDEETNSAPEKAQYYLKYEGPELVVAENESLQLSIVRTDDETILSDDMVWISSEPSIASISATGLVSPNKLGETRISCMSVDGRTTYINETLTVVKAAEQIVLSETKKTLLIGADEELEKCVLQATVLPEDTYYNDIIWSSSDEEIVTVDQEGTVFAVAVGDAVVSATSSYSKHAVDAKCNISVIRAVDTIILSSENEVLYTNATAQLTVEVLPEDATIKELVWTSSDPDVVSVNTDGSLRAISVGTAEITCQATDGSGAAATCQIEVRAKVNGLRLSESSLKLLIGADDEKASCKLEYEILPADAYISTLSWMSSDESVVTVDEEGVVRATGVGEAEITAVSDDPEYTKPVTCRVSVGQAVVSIGLNESDLILYTGAQYDLDETISPEIATNQIVAWQSLNPEIATVDKKGIVRAHKVGTTVIECLATDDSEVSAQCKVEVRAKVTGTALNENKVILLVGGGEGPASYQLVCITKPEDAYIQSFTWSSSDTDVVTVDQNGLIRAVAEGQASITAVSDDPEYTKPISCKVTVKKAVTAIEIKETDFVLNKGESRKISVNVVPNDAYNQKLTWNSSDESVVSVDQNGNMRAVGVGTATISCSTNDGTDITIERKITVIQKVAGLKAESNSITIINGETKRLSVSVQPVDATNKQVNWSSSNPSCASVDSQGIITAQKPGKATITAVSASDSDISCTIKVTVETDNPVSLVTVSFGTTLVNHNYLYLDFHNNCVEKTIKQIVFEMKTKEKGLLGASDRDVYITDPINIEPGHNYQFSEYIRNLDDVKKVTIVVKKVIFSDGSQYEIPSDGKHYYDNYYLFELK